MITWTLLSCIETPPPPLHPYLSSVMTEHRQCGVILDLEGLQSEISLFSQYGTKVAPPLRDNVSRWWMSNRSTKYFKPETGISASELPAPLTDWQTDWLTDWQTDWLLTAQQFHGWLLGPLCLLNVLAILWGGVSVARLIRPSRRNMACRLNKLMHISRGADCGQYSEQSLHEKEISIPKRIFISLRSVPDQLNSRNMTSTISFPIIVLLWMASGLFSFSQSSSCGEYTTCQTCLNNAQCSWCAESAGFGGPLVSWWWHMCRKRS